MREIIHIIGREDDVEGYITWRKITEQVTAEAYRGQNSKRFVGSVQEALSAGSKKPRGFR